MNKIDELIFEFDSITKLLREASDRWDKLVVKNEKNYFNFTDKEAEIYGLFLGGLDLDQISKKLDISIKTSTTHRDRIRKKMGLKGAKEFYRHLKSK